MSGLLGNIYICLCCTEFLSEYYLSYLYRTMPPRRASTVNGNENGNAEILAQLATQNEQLVNQNAALLQAVQQLAQNATGNQTGARTLAQMSEIVQKKKPPTYNGKGDPVDYENWVREMEKIFLTVGCPEAFKARIVVFYLREQADIYWQGIREEFLTPVDMQDENGDVIQVENGWDELKEQLEREFFHETLRRAKKIEFEDLKQARGMPV